MATVPEVEPQGDDPERARFLSEPCFRRACADFAFWIAIANLGMGTMIISIGLLDILCLKWGCVWEYMDVLAVLWSLFNAQRFIRDIPPFVTFFPRFHLGMRIVCFLMFCRGLFHPVVILGNVTGVWFLDVLIWQFVSEFASTLRRLVVSGPQIARFLVLPACMLECFAFGVRMGFITLINVYMNCNSSHPRVAPVLGTEEEVVSVLMRQPVGYS